MTSRTTKRGSPRARRPERADPASGKKKRSARATNQDRMPPIPESELSAAQRAAAAEIAAGPRGGLVGPFIAALRSPELMARLQRLGEYLRYGNAIGPRLTELAILITARAWSQPFEWAIHVGEAEARGIASPTIAAIAHGRKPARLAAEEAIVYDYVRELHATQSVSDATFARAVGAFGEAGVVDLTAVVGYYTTLAMILNVARTPVPPGERSALAELPTKPEMSRARGKSAARASKGSRGRRRSEVAARPTVR
jgi:4-carboxymuconolactone decarboxylase